MSHIRKRGKNSWQIVVELSRDPHSGDRNRHIETFRGKKQDAEMRLSELLQDVRASNFNYKKPEKITLEEQLQKYLKVVKNRVRERTFERYKDIVEQHLTPALGDVFLTELTPHFIQEYYNHCLVDGRLDGKEGGLSTATVKHHHVVLRSALQLAVEHRALVNNPCSSVKPPRISRREGRFLSATELNKLLTYLRDNDSVIYIPTYIAAYTGARRSEVLGMKWRDIDFNNKTLTICRTLQQGKNGKLYFDNAKSDKSHRQIALTEEDVVVLKQQKKKQAQHKLKVGSKYQDNDLVCATANGAPMKPCTFSGNFWRTVRVLNLEVSLHDLRHTHITLLMAGGAQMKYISARVGHASTAFTEDVYGHRTLNDDFRLAELFNSILNTNESAK